MKSNAFFRLVVLIGIVALASACEAQEEQWLQYRSSREAGDIVGDHGSLRLQLDLNKPEGVELPEFKADDPFFGKWFTPMVEKGHLLFALDRSQKGGMYDLLYIDSNGDGQLKDESALEAYRIDQYSTYIGPVKVMFQIEDGPVSYHLNFRFYKSGDTTRLYLYPGGWYEGDITIDGGKKRCVLIDHNVNGTFNDKSLDAEQCDRIRIGEENDQDTRFVGNFIEVGDVLYRPEIARDGAFVILSKADDVKMGTVRLQESIAEFSAGGENGLLKVKPEGGVGSLPVGKYRINDWVIEKQDDQGAQWRVRGSRFSDEKGLFDINENQELELTIGTPIVATLTESDNKGTHSFRHNMNGKDGESIELMRNGSRPQAPKVNIKNKEGTYDRTYSFAYG